RSECLTRGIERNKRLARLSVLDELDAPEAAAPAYLSDRGVLALQLTKLLGEHAAHLGGVFDDALFLEGLDRGDGRRAGQRMARVGETAGEVLVAHPVGDRLADDHRAERDVAGID